MWTHRPNKNNTQKQKQLTQKRAKRNENKLRNELEWISWEFKKTTTATATSLEQKGLLSFDQKFLKFPWANGTEFFQCGKRQLFAWNFSMITLNARGPLVRQRRGASERVVLVGERPLAQAVKSFELADPITLPFISPESKFDPGNLIGRLKKRFLKGLLLVKCAMILANRFYLSVKTKDCGCQSKEIGVSMEVRLLSVGARGFFSRRFATRLRRSILSPLTRKKPLAPRVFNDLNSRFNFNSL